MHPAVQELLAGHPRAAARLITLLENNVSEKGEILRDLDPFTGRAYVIGITGAPGTGKSSLAAQLVRVLRQENFTLGVIAVDPTSPFSGGALLGDRIRMQEHALDPGVFIRSMGTRGSLGGLARATREAIKVLDAAGKDFILVETVGVGQSEVDIMGAADTVLVTLTPGGGDDIQAQKAGIMEIADIFVLNKADLPGAERAFRHLKGALDLVDFTGKWRPPIVKTDSVKGTGVTELWAEIRRRRAFQEGSGELAKKRQDRRLAEMWELVQAELLAHLRRQGQEDKKTAATLDEVRGGRLSPYEGADKILMDIFRL